MFIKCERKEKLILHVTTYGPKSTKSSLGDAAPLKDIPPPQKNILLQNSPGPHNSECGEGEFTPLNPIFSLEVC